MQPKSQDSGAGQSVSPNPNNPLMSNPSESQQPAQPNPPSQVQVDQVSQAASENESAEEEAEEKVWVDRAKSVVARTANDPYSLHEMIGTLRAQYLKERYGKEIAAPKD